MVDFYGKRLGFPTVQGREHPDSREAVFEMHGLLLKLVDNDFGRFPRLLGATIERVNLVIEVEDIDEARDSLEQANKHLLIAREKAEDATRAKSEFLTVFIGRDLDREQNHRGSEGCSRKNTILPSMGIA